MQTDYDFCISSYLALRYVAKPGIGWKPGVMPEFPNPEEQGQFKVRTWEEVLGKLREVVVDLAASNVGILLSAGMDSAIVAALLPRGTRAYTVQFDAEGAIDEAADSRRIADRLGLNHTVVTVGWDDYNDCMDLLMKVKKAPLHPVEVGLYRAARVAADDGIKMLAVGNGADSTFGGMDKLLSKDWTFDEFVARYTFLEPELAVEKPVSLLDVYETYRTPTGVDVPGFLKRVHGLGIIQMFENAIHAAGCSLVAPFETLSLDAPLDLKRIRGGEPKYILAAVFNALFPGIDPPPKIAFARPVTQWLQDWGGPRRSEFLPNLAMSDFSGEQKWQLYCLERFLNLLDRGDI